MPSAGRYRYCPMCRTSLATQADRDGVERIECAACRWPYFPTNVLGVNIVPITATGELVMIFPPGEPSEAPAALPGGVVEYGEHPVDAAVRETLEETGLDVRIGGELGWWFEPKFLYGPMLSFMFLGLVIGGSAKASPEGEVGTFRLSEVPEISPNRRGSRRALDAYLLSIQTTGSSTGDSE